MDHTQHQCPQRPAAGSPFNLPEHDTWHPERNTCSYCGSLNQDEFMRLVEAGEATLTPTDKNYKVYVDAPGRSHAKFYFQHLSGEQQLRFVELYNERKIRFFNGNPFYVLPFFMRVAEG